MWSNSSLPLLPDLLWAGVVVPVRNQYVIQIQVLNHLILCKQMIDVEMNFLCLKNIYILKIYICVQIKLFVLDRNSWNCFIVYKNWIIYNE